MFTRKNKNQTEQIEKGSTLTKAELKKRLLILEAKLDPLEDFKITYSRMYDTLLKDNNNKQKLLKILEEEGGDLEPSVIKRKRERSKKKKSSKPKKTKTESNTPSNRWTKPVVKPSTSKRSTRSQTERKIINTADKVWEVKPKFQVPAKSKVVEKVIMPKTINPANLGKTLEKLLPSDKKMTVKSQKVGFKGDYLKLTSEKVGNLVDPDSERQEREKSAEKYQKFVEWRKTVSAHKEDQGRNPFENITSFTTTKQPIYSNLNKNNLFNDLFGKNTAKIEANEAFERLIRENKSHVNKNNDNFVNTPENLFNQNGGKGQVQGKTVRFSTNTHYISQPEVIVAKRIDLNFDNKEDSIDGLMDTDQVEHKIGPWKISSNKLLINLPEAKNESKSSLKNVNELPSNNQINNQFKMENVEYNFNNIDYSAIPTHPLTFRTSDNNLNKQDSLQLNFANSKNRFDDDEVHYGVGYQPMEAGVWQHNNNNFVAEDLNKHFQIGNNHHQKALAEEIENECGTSLTCLLKSVVAGTSLVTAKLIAYYIVHSPDKVITFLQEFDYDALSNQAQVGLVIFAIIVIFYFSNYTINFLSNNSKANKVFSCIREMIIDNGEVLFEEQIINYYSGQVEVDRDYFVKNILPEVRRLASQENIQQIKETVLENGYEVDDVVWKVFIRTPQIYHTSYPEFEEDIIVENVPNSQQGYQNVEYNYDYNQNNLNNNQYESSDA